MSTNSGIQRELLDLVSINSGQARDLGHALWYARAAPHLRSHIYKPQGLQAAELAMDPIQREQVRPPSRIPMLLLLLLLALTI